MRIVVENDNRVVLLFVLVDGDCYVDYDNCSKMVLVVVVVVVVVAW
jgi:hypothetical protein